MGQVLGTLNTKHLDLNQDDKPTFKPTSGFKYKRKERKICACESHLVSARIPPKFRDYCANTLLKYQMCRYYNMPWLWRCHHEKHEYLTCEMEDYKLRMKEFERERRLREREKRIRAGIC